MKQENKSKLENSAPQRLSGSDAMPFGKYKGRLLREVPDGYLRYLAEQDWMYEHRELCEYIEHRLYPEAKPQPKVRKPEPKRGPVNTGLLKEWLKQA